MWDDGGGDWRGGNAIYDHGGGCDGGGCDGDDGRPRWCSEQGQFCPPPPQHTRPTHVYVYLSCAGGQPVFISWAYLPHSSNSPPPGPAFLIITVSLGIFSHHVR